MEITLVPYAGLCNRLNAIASGLAYVQEHPDTVLKIKWHKWFHCNCRFKDLFKQLDPIYPPVSEIYVDLKDVPGHKLNFYIPQRLRKLFYDFNFIPSMSANDFERLTKGMQKVYVNKENNFCKYTINSSLAKIFVPTDEIQKRIDRITHEWGGGNRTAH